MNTEPLHLPLRVISEINAALVAGRKAAEALHTQQMKIGYSKELHLAALEAKDACIVFDVWVMRKLGVVEVMVAA